MASEYDPEKGYGVFAEWVNLARLADAFEDPIVTIAGMCRTLGVSSARVREYISRASDDEHDAQIALAERKRHAAIRALLEGE